MLRLLPQITCAVADRLYDDRGASGRAHGSGQRLQRVDVPPIARDQKDRARICLRNRLSGRCDNANDGDHGDCHDQQQGETADSKDKASSLR